MTLESLQKYTKLFVPEIPHTPTARFASVILLRETKSYAIFTTEGGEQQDVEETQAGLTHPDTTSRLVLFKRKQVAPERRTGKALTRQYGIFPFARFVQDNKVVEVVYGHEAIVEAITRLKPKDRKFMPNSQDVSESVQSAIKGMDKPKEKSSVTIVSDCYLMDGLSSHTADCLIYGYAAIEGEGARKSRAMTDTCFTIRPYELIQKQINFNVIDEKTHTSSTLTKFDYTMPGVFLPSVETTVDLTADEFVYVLGNILRTTRYGKESSRQGYIRNHILAIAFSDVELFANLELTQAFYDAFMDNGVDLTGSLALSDFQAHAPTVIEQLTSQIAGRLSLVTGDALESILQEVRELNGDETRLAAFLKDLNTQAASFVV